MGKAEVVVDEFAFDESRREAKLVRLVGCCTTCATISRCSQLGRGGDSAVEGAYRRIACVHNTALSRYRPEIQRLFAVSRLCPGLSLLLSPSPPCPSVCL